MSSGLILMATVQVHVYVHLVVGALMLIFRTHPSESDIHRKSNHCVNWAFCQLTFSVARKQPQLQLFQFHVCWLNAKSREREAEKGADLEGGGGELWEEMECGAGGSRFCSSLCPAVVNFSVVISIKQQLL